MRVRLALASFLVALAATVVPPAPVGAAGVPWQFVGLLSGQLQVRGPVIAPGAVPVVGQFFANEADDVLWYTPGPGGDAIWRAYGDGTFLLQPLTVNGTYTPHVGTFAAPDGYDDVLWYSKTGASQLWDHNADGTVSTSALPSVTGAGQVLVGDFVGDGIDDVVRYRPGAASDSWWDFQALGPVVRPLAVTGTYRPVVGRFGADAVDDILWYAPGAGLDRLWDQHPGGARTETTYDVRGTYTPVVGRFSLDGQDDLLWYAPGPAADTLWDFHGTTYSATPLTVNGTYRPVVCQCDDGFFSPYDDIWWVADGAAPDPVWRVTNAAPFTYTATTVALTSTGPAAVGRFGPGASRETLLVRRSAA